MAACSFLQAVISVPPWKKTFYTAYVAQICAMIGFSFVMPFLPFYIRDLGVESIQEATRWAGIAFAATPIAMVVSAPIWGALADRYGRKMMVIRAMLGGAVVLSLMGLVRNVEQLVWCRALQGVLTGTVVASVALVASVTPAGRSGYTLGMMQSAVSIGATIGPLFGGIVADHFGYRATFFVGAAMLLCGGLLVSFGVSEHFTPPDARDRKARGNYAQVFASAGIFMAILVLMSIRFANAAVSPVFSLFVDRLRGTRPGLNMGTGLVFSIAGFAMAIAAAGFGHLVDMWGYKKLLVPFSLLAGIFACAQALAQNFTHILVLRALFGVAVGGMMTVVNVLVRDITHDKNIGKAYGVTTGISAIGWAVGYLSGGYIGAYWGLRAPFVVTGTCLVLVALLAAWRLNSPKRTPPTLAGEDRQTR